MLPNKSQRWATVIDNFKNGMTRACGVIFSFSLYPIPTSFVKLAVSWESGHHKQLLRHTPSFSCTKEILQIFFQNIQSFRYSILQRSTPTTAAMPEKWGEFTLPILAGNQADPHLDEDDDSSTPPSSPPAAATIPRRSKFDDEEAEDSDVLDSWDAAEDSEGILTPATTRVLRNVC